METLESIIKVLQLNSSLFIYIGAFTFLIIFVSRYLMTPYYQRFLNQQAQTKGSLEKARQILEKNQGLQKEYEEQILAFNSRLQNKIKEEKTRMSLKQQALIEETHSQARTLIETSKKSLLKDFNKAKSELDQEARILAQDLVLKVSSPSWS